MPVLTSQALLTPYPEEGELVLALVGEDHMDTPTPVLMLVFPTRCGLGGVDAEAAGVAGAAGAGLRHTSTSSGKNIN